MKLKSNQYFFICLVLLAMSYTLFAMFRWWVADKSFAKGKNLSEAGYVSQAFPLLERAVKLMPNEPLFHDGLSDTAAKIAYGLSQQNATDAAQQALELAISESDQTIKLNRVHLNFWKTRIRIWLILAQLDPNLAQNALQDFQNAISLSPTDAKLYYNLGLLQLQLDQKESARKSLQTALDLKPNYTAAQAALIQLQTP